MYGVVVVGFLDGLAQFQRDVLVDRQLPRVDDAEIHAGTDRVIEKHAVHRFSNRIIAAERERHIADATADHRERHTLLDLPRRLYEIETIARVLVDARGHCENIGIEDDVFGGKADFLRQQVVGALTDFDFAGDRVGLTLLVEGHHDDGGAVLANFGGLR